MNVSKIPIYSNDKMFHYIVVPDDLNDLLVLYSNEYSKEPHYFNYFFLWNLERDICSIANDEYDFYKKGMSYRLQQEQPHLNLEYFSKIWNNHDTSLCMDNVYNMWCQCLTSHKKELVLNKAMVKLYG